MHSVQFIKHTNNLIDQPQAANRPSGCFGLGSIRRWLGRTTRKWQERKMAAALHALEDRILRDIGMQRSDIESIVRGFDDRELQMTPLATLPPVQASQPLRQVA